MPGYTREEYADMLLAYGAAHSNARKARRIYQERYPNRRLPDRDTFPTTYRRFRETGNLNVRVPQAAVRQLPVEIDQQILAAFEEDPTTSTRVVAAALGVSQWKVWSVMHGEHQHPYHYTPVQAEISEEMSSDVTDEISKADLNKESDLSLSSAEKPLEQIFEEESEDMSDIKKLVDSDLKLGDIMQEKLELKRRENLTEEERRFEDLMKEKEDQMVKLMGTRDTAAIQETELAELMKDETLNQEKARLRTEEHHRKQEEFMNMLLDEKKTREEAKKEALQKEKARQEAILAERMQKEKERIDKERRILARDQKVLQEKMRWKNLTPEQRCKELKEVRIKNLLEEKRLCLLDANRRCTLKSELRKCKEYKNYLDKKAKKKKRSKDEEDASSKSSRSEVEVEVEVEEETSEPEPTVDFVEWASEQSEKSDKSDKSEKSEETDESAKSEDSEKSEELEKSDKEVAKKKDKKAKKPKAHELLMYVVSSKDRVRNNLDASINDGKYMKSKSEIRKHKRRKSDKGIYRGKQDKFSIGKKGKKHKRPDTDDETDNKKSKKTEGKKHKKKYRKGEDEDDYCDDSLSYITDSDTGSWKSRTIKSKRGLGSGSATKSSSSTTGTSGSSSKGSSGPESDQEATPKLSKKQLKKKEAERKAAERKAAKEEFKLPYEKDFEKKFKKQESKRMKAATKPTCSDIRKREKALKKLAKKNPALKREKVGILVKVNTPCNECVMKKGHVSSKKKYKTWIGPLYAKPTCEIPPRAIDMELLEKIKKK